ncbi:hypothetical protein SAMN04488028_11510 [Reichenbachiella agariperforans]|uniref:Lipoprotein n=1 Tax=Reichenbachiella agariperforans TaxID=156994 RepID=A0A1M6WUX4_REIAG|nr:right-handed parallel beta-helix repeat-containing protein [Reichenbachiella agariperforans]SHK97379.1 hypothetical protein SAMN04488028_11510 [Reichenbachiella agariperforans]
MKKLLSLLMMGGVMGSMISCSEDDSPSLTPEEKQTEVIAASQAAVDAQATSDATATGASDLTVFDGWTLAYNAGQMGSARKAADAIKVVEVTTVDVTANISEDVTWSADVIYVLKARVTVLDGATLTIEPGTVIKGDASLTGANAAVLMIAKGGKIMAEGTAENPIIMTSSDDDITPGQMTGTTLDQDDKGKWGGLVILGKAPVSAKTDNPQIEGVDAEDTNGQYGGDNAADNSGVVKYVSIRHGGAQIAEGSEINGLTLGGVGNGTTIENIEIYGNSDDGVEFFGGTVDATNVLVYAVGDDGLDVDQSYAGTVDNFVVYVDGNSDEGLEIDGREGAMDDTFVLKNGSILSIGGASTTADFKSKAKGSVTNVVFEDGKVKLSASFDVDTEDYEEEEDAAYNVAMGDLTFSKVNTSSFEVYTSSFDEE